MSLSATDEAVMDAIEHVDLGKSESAAAAKKKKRVVCKCVRRSIYGNLWKLLGDQVRESLLIPCSVCVCIVNVGPFHLFIRLPI